MGRYLLTIFSWDTIYFVVVVMGASIYKTTETQMRKFIGNLETFDRPVEIPSLHSLVYDIETHICLEETNMRSNMLVDQRWKETWKHLEFL